MTIERQPAVNLTIPSRLADVSVSGDGVVLYFDGFSAEVPGSHAVKAFRRMQEAKRKGCGKFRIVLEFPVSDVPSSKIDKLVHGMLKK